MTPHRADPLYFGPPDRPLAGWLHGPEGPQAAPLGVIVCSPFGLEWLSAHRSLRHFAAAFAAAGVAALRFDYDGTGDSAGHPADPRQLAHWIESVDRAIDALRELTRVDQVCLLGLRLGSLVATLAAERRGDVAGLVALAPATSGRAHLREFRALAELGARRTPPAWARITSGVEESAGFVLSAETRESLGGVNLLESATRPAPRVLLLERPAVAPADAWARHLQALGASVDRRPFRGYAEMMLDPHNAVVPTDAVRQAVDWVTAIVRALPPRHADTRAIDPDALVTTVHLEASAGGGQKSAIRESAVCVDPGRRLFGVLAEPDTDFDPHAEPPRRAVILLNSGGVHHVGPGRFYVTSARFWAARGDVVLRLDVSGLGESAPRPPEPENVVYTRHATADVAAAVRFVHERFGPIPCDAMGICSGAYHTLKAAVAGVPLRGIVVINPLTFFWKDGMPLDEPEHVALHGFRQYLRTRNRAGGLGAAAPGPGQPASRRADRLAPRGRLRRRTPARPGPTAPRPAGRGSRRGAAADREPGHRDAVRVLGERPGPAAAARTRRLHRGGARARWRAADRDARRRRPYLYRALGAPAAGGRADGAVPRHRAGAPAPLNDMTKSLTGATMQTDRLKTLKSIAMDVAAKHADPVDRGARFPAETLDALKRERFLSAGVPEELGGWNAGLRDLATMCSLLAQGCGSSAMVLAMHYIQVACLVRHGRQSAFVQRYLRELVDRQLLLASMTSEVGTSGDTRSSVCAVARDGDRFTLNKDATTGSYCEHADGILVTARQSDSAPANDQVLALVRKGDYTLKQTTTWDTLGMRGTSSPGFRLESCGPVDQIVPGSFADSSAQTMVPYSHILWSSLWNGIATDAVARAGAYVRAEARRKPGAVPATAPRLAKVSAELQAMRNNWTTLADEFDALTARGDGMETLQSIGWGLRMNNLKMSASEQAPQIVHHALQIVGIAGYKNDSPFSVGRHYRDVLSASLMISNERIANTSASMLLVFKDE